MTACAVRTCETKSTDKIIKFSFPIQPRRSKLWLQACFRYDLLHLDTKYIRQTRKICALHFEDRMFANAEHTSLTQYAIPTIFHKSQKFKRKAAQLSAKEECTKKKICIEKLINPSDVKDELEDGEDQGNNSYDLDQATAADSVMNVNHNQLTPETNKLDKPKKEEIDGITTCLICFSPISIKNALNINTTKRENELLSNIITNFASIEIHWPNAISDVICKDCAETLFTAYDFKNVIVSLYKRDPLDLTPVVDKNYEEITIIQEENEVKPTSTIHEVIDIKPELPLLIEKKHKTKKEIIAPKQRTSKTKQNNITKAQNEEKVARTKKIYVVGDPITNPDQKSNSVKTEINENSLAPVKKFEKIYLNIPPQVLDSQITLSQFNQATLKKNPYRELVGQRIDDVIKKNEEALLIRHKQTEPVLIIAPQRQPMKAKPCDQCQESFHTDAGLKRHLTEFHGQEVAQYSCDVCGLRFASIPARNLHLRIHEADNECPICNKRFKSYISWYQHKQSHNENKKYPCNICNKKLPTEYQLQLHIKIHENQDNGEENEEAVKTIIVCDKCNETFDTCSQLRRHSQIHRTPLEKCPVCELQFENLADHIKIKHESGSSEAKEVFPCDICDKQFKALRNLKIHIKVKHP